MASLSWLWDCILSVLICIVGNLCEVNFTYSTWNFIMMYCFLAVLWMSFCLLSLAVWSHMTTISSWQQWAASQTWCCSVKVFLLFYLSNKLLTLGQLQVIEVSLFFLHMYPCTHTCTAKDARALLKQLFLLTTQFRYNCTSELIRAIEACTQHTIRW